MPEFIKPNTIFINKIYYLIYNHFTNFPILRTHYLIAHSHQLSFWDSSTYKRWTVEEELETDVKRTPLFIVTWGLGPRVLEGYYNLYYTQANPLPAPTLH